MSPEEKAKQSLQGMFRTDGWKVFHEEIVTAISQITIDTVSDQSQLDQAKGRLQILRQIAVYEDLVNAEEPDEGSE